MSRPMGTIRKPFQERFFAKIFKDSKFTSCWIWTGGLDGSGYGQIRRDANHGMVKAHRTMWEMTHGPIPKGLNVLHTCDLRPCVNPEHLFLGTQKDNADDMVAKGRHRTWTDPACLARGDRSGYRLHFENYPKGSVHPHSIFTEDDIIEMRRIFDTREESSTKSEVIQRLANKYKASFSIIDKIVRRKRWRHVP